jgi:hypothetical protein
VLACGIVGAMSKLLTTSIRYTPEDQAILTELQRLTGLHAAVSIIRLALREALASRKKGAAS